MRRQLTGRGAQPEGYSALDWYISDCTIWPVAGFIAQPQPGNISMASRPSGLVVRKASRTRSSGFPTR
ncbi:MAG TPA: hypothetical protein VLT82_06095 [Myxococcaceae bacterium]|nr:hypothetical protein [Myxococcaceae bacterium]